MMLYFKQRHMLRYQGSEICFRVHDLRSDFSDLYVEICDWRMKRSAYHAPFRGDWNLNITLSEMVDEFGLNVLRLLRMCDVWLLERGFHDGRQKFGESVAPYRHDHMKLIDAWSISSETKPRSALVETVVTELIPYPEFALLDYPTVHHRHSR